MQHFKGETLSRSEDFFKVLATTAKTQFATMYLGEGQVSGEFGSDHPQADQYVVVVSGTGFGKGESAEAELSEGDVVLVPASEKHQFRGGEGGLKTITFYGPVAYPEEASSGRLSLR